MSKEVKAYKQCTLVRQLENATQHTTSWIPECFAVVGDVLKLRNHEGEWVNGWKVVSASDAVDAKTVEANARNYMNQRKASDVVFADIKKQNEEAARKAML